MSHWYKRDCEFWTNSKIVAGGLDVGLVFDAILALNAIGHRDGMLSPIELDPKVIATRLTTTGITVARVRAAIARCYKVGLLREIDGVAEIAGWDGTWQPSASSTERSRKHRERRSRRNDAHVSDATDATLHEQHEQRPIGNGGNALEERRGEERRVPAAAASEYVPGTGAGRARTGGSRPPTRRGKHGRSDAAAAEVLSRTDPEPMP